MRAPATPRLAWLDVLRGMAALTVALHHAAFYYVPHLQFKVLPAWFNPGMYGVLVFFMISGYIVPASLERHGRVRDFWIGRIFRVYPLLLVACAANVLPFVLGVRGLRAGLERQDPLIALFAHVTMLQDVLAVPNAINVLWTLSYEMAFYLLIVALFVGGVHRHSVPVAVVLAAVALLGGVLPTMLLSRTVGTGPTVVVAAVLLAVAIGAAVSRRTSLRAAGGILGGVLAVVLVSVNGRIAPREGLMILAVMFTGTVIYRVQHGQIGGRSAALSVIPLSAGMLIFGPWNTLLAALTFAGAMALRHRRMPRPLVGLGVISYSVYLLHSVLLMISDQLFGTSGRDEVWKLIVFMGVLLTVSSATYRCVEAPTQRLGRRVARRFGSEVARPAAQAGGDRPVPVRSAESSAL
jgi:peptidoglycan/LPS O-acetylase OafA/YrhL